FSLARAVRENAASLLLLSGQRSLLSVLRDALPVYAELVPGRDDRGLLRWARGEGIACVATNDVHFVHREGHRLPHTLRALAWTEGPRSSETRVSRTTFSSWKRSPHARRGSVGADRAPRASWPTSWASRTSIPCATTSSSSASSRRSARTRPTSTSISRGTSAIRSSSTSYRKMARPCARRWSRTTSG